MDRDKSALMLGHSGAESVHAAMRTWSPQTKIGLVESCVQDAARAASQVGALNNFKLHGRKGRGPSLFELQICDATVVGNIESFFPKLNSVLTQPDLREFSAVDALKGDVETVQMESGARVTSGPHVIVEDSHRPDVVLVTRPKKRKFKGIADRDATLLSPESEVVNLSSDVSGESDTVIVEPTPCRSTRSNPVATSSPAPEPVRQRVEEANVQPGMLFLSRTSVHGKSPICRGRKCCQPLERRGLGNLDGVLLEYAGRPEANSQMQTFHMFTGFVPTISVARGAHCPRPSPVPCPQYHQNFLSALELISLKRRFFFYRKMEWKLGQLTLLLSQRIKSVLATSSWM